MPRHSSYRTNHGIDSVGSDWSSSQLIIGIAVAIVFGVTCFATGYVIALYDNPLEPTAANSDNTEQTEATTPNTVPPPAPATTTKPAPEKTAASETPAPAAVPAPTEVASAIKAPAPTPVPVPAPEPAKPMETIQRTGLRPTTIEALPEPGGPTPMVRTPVDLNKAPAPKIEPMDPDATTAVPGITPPAPAEKPATVASNVPAVTPPAEKKPDVAAPGATPVITPPATKTAEVKPPVTPPAAKTPPVTPPDPKAAAKEAKETKETKEAAATPTVTKGSFGIQVASFDGPQRSTQAKDFQRNLKTKAQQNADIIVTADGTYHKVVISGYDTRDAAKAACEKMKSKPGLEGAWVVRLP